MLTLKVQPSHWIFCERGTSRTSFSMTILLLQPQKQYHLEIGIEIASHSGKRQLISESFQYVSVEKTLRSLLQNAE